MVVTTGLFAAATFWQGMPPLLTYALLATAGLVAFLLFVGKVPFSYSFMNLLVRWRTTLMTALAFTMVIGLLIMMMAFVNGMSVLTESSGQPGNVMILAEGATDESFSNLGFSDAGDLENQPGILRENDQALMSRETYLIATAPVANPQPGRPKRRFLQVRGLDDPKIASRVHAIDLYPGGEWFSDAGVRSLDPTKADSEAAVEVVVGEGLAGEMGRDRTESELAKASNKNRLDVGDRFELGEKTWLVVGVMKSSGSTFDSEIWAKRSLIGPLFGKPNYSTLVARTAGPNEAKEFRTSLLENYKKSSISAQVETDYYKKLSELNLQFLIAIQVVTVIMAIGGVFGVMNTMFAATSQRVKDIGVLRLLGYSPGHVMVSFLLESLLLALVGGLLGCAIGMLADGWTANSILSGGPGGGKFVVLEMAVTIGTLGLGLVTAMAMGLLGGIVPALLAMRLTALEALRS